MSPHPPLRRREGFTLFEVLVALAVSSIVSLAGWAFYHHELRDLTHQSAALDATEAVRAATSFIAREIRMAGYDPRVLALVAPGYKGIREAGATTLHLEWDANGNGVIDTGAGDPNAESVLYTYDSSNRTILRTVAGTTHVLVKKVPPGAFSFTYLDLLGNSLPMTGSPAILAALSRDLIATIVLRIGVETASVSPSATFRATTRVAVRARILDRL